MRTFGAGACLAVAAGSQRTAARDDDVRINHTNSSSNNSNSISISNIISSSNSRSY